MVLMYMGRKNHGAHVRARRRPALVSKGDQLRVAVIGGDERELILVQALQHQGFDVVVVGYPPLEELHGVTYASSIVEAVQGTVAVVAPMSNTDKDGVILAHLDPKA